MASEAKSRPARVAAQLRQEIARLVSRDLGDPRLEGLVVANVTATSDELIEALKSRAPAAFTLIIPATPFGGGRDAATAKLEEALGAHGLQPIDSVGERFDPKVHEAVGHEESTEHPEDTVVSELRRGYRVRDRVVRPALVKVARPPALPADSDLA